MGKDDLKPEVGGVHDYCTISIARFDADIEFEQDGATTEAGLDGDPKSPVTPLAD